jgi:O-antigen ligase
LPATRNALIELAAVLACFVLVLQLTAEVRSKAWRRLGLVVVAYTFCVALLAVVQYFSSPGKIYWLVTPRSHGWIFGPYLNHDHYAGLMEMLIPLSAGYALSQRRRVGSAALTAFVVLFPVTSVLLSGSRGGMVALLAEAGLLVVMLLRSAPRGHTVRMAVGVAVAGAAAFVAFLWMDNANLLSHLETVLEPEHATDVSFTYRIETARDSLRMFRDHWQLGTGLGSFEYAFPKYQSLPGDEVWDHAHDDFVETLAETGVIGGVLVAAAIVLWFRLAFSGLRERLRPGNTASWIQLGAAVGCCGLLLHSFFDFNLHIPANALWFAVCAALAVRTPAYTARSS